jgi:hypothetical protein
MSSRWRTTFYFERSSMAFTLLRYIGLVTVFRLEVGLSLPSKKVPPVIMSLSFEIGFLFLLALRTTSRASMVSFLIFCPESST